MKVKEIVSVLSHKDIVRIHDSDTYEIIYKGNKEGVPKNILDQTVKYMSVDLTFDIDTYHYIPTLAITLGSNRD